MLWYSTVGMGCGLWCSGVRVVVLHSGYGPLTVVQWGKGGGPPHAAAHRYERKCSLRSYNELIVLTMSYLGEFSIPNHNYVLLVCFFLRKELFIGRQASDRRYGS